MSISPLDLAAKIKAYIDLIMEHLFVFKTNHRRESFLAGSWSPPPVGSLMVNVDAAIFTASRQMGAGIVVRDHMGSCIAASCSSIAAITVPELAEALAVRLALSFAKDEGMDNILVASDCLAVVQRVASKEKDRSLCGPVIQDIQKLFSSFSACTLVHVRRQQNVAAHILARSSEASSCSCVAWCAPRVYPGDNLY